MSKNDKLKSEGGEKRHRFVQVLVGPEEHKALRTVAWEKDITLAELLRDIIKNYLRKEN